MTMTKMFGAPDEGKPVVYRLGGSQVYHVTLDCARLRRPASRGSKIKTPSPFDVDQAQAMGWTPCVSCGSED
jgi:hypothetical protein